MESTTGGPRANPDLDHADLSNTDASGANLSRARPAGAKVSGVSIDGAELTRSHEFGDRTGKESRLEPPSPSSSHTPPRGLRKRKASPGQSQDQLANGRSATNAEKPTGGHVAVCSPSRTLPGAKQGLLRNRY